MKKLLVKHIVLMSLCGLAMAMENPHEISKKRTVDQQPHSEKTKLIKSGDVLLEVEGKVYQVPKESLEHSGVLKKIVEYHTTMKKSAQEGAPIKILEGIEGVGGVWELVILSALNTGATYKLSNEYTPEELVAIIQAADYLDIKYLYKAALQKSVEYIKANIDLFGKNPQAFDAFKELPDHFVDLIITQVINKYTFAKDGALLKGHRGNVSSIAFSSDGAWIASGSDDGSIKLWDVATGKELRTLNPHDAGWILSIAVSPNNTLLAFISKDSRIRIWDLNSDKEIRVIGQGIKSESLAFSPDGKFLASWSDDKTVTLWAVETGNEIKTSIKGEEWVSSIVFSPNGRLLAFDLFYDNAIKIWDLEKNREKQVLKGHHDFVNSIVFSPDGAFLASGSGDKTVKLWDVESGNEIKTFTGHTGYVSSVVFSADGRLLVSGSYDGTVRLWDVESGNEIKTFNSRWTLSVAFSPDNKTLASGSQDKIKLWKIPDIAFTFTFDQALFAYYIIHHKRAIVGYNLIVRWFYDPIADFIKKSDQLRNIYATFTEEQKKMLYEVIATE